MDKAIETIKRRIEDARANERKINSMNPSRMVDIQGYAWASIAFQLEELLKELEA